MDWNTFTQTTRAFQNRQAFRLFTLVTVGGNRDEVAHGEAIVVRDGLATHIALG